MENLYIFPFSESLARNFSREEQEEQEYPPCFVCGDPGPIMLLREFLGKRGRPFCAKDAIATLVSLGVLPNPREGHPSST